MERRLRKMKRTYAAIIIAAILSLLMIAPADADQTFEVPGDCEITLPDGYRVSESTPVETEFIKDDFTCVSVMADKRDLEGISLETLGDAILDKFEDNGIKTSNSLTEEINGVKTLRICGHMTADGTEMAVHVYVFKFEDCLVTLSCGCPSKIEADKIGVFRNIANSLKRKR